jgi:glycosyltransferase involved in cell wall biosynthesis
MINASPKVSIVILSYNQEQYLEQAILSAINQTYQNIEIIISDNGSTDSSKTIATNYLTDDRVIFLDYKENLSISMRQNQATQKSSGDFISQLYADDFYLPSKIEHQVKIFSTLSDDWGVVHGPGIQLDDKTGLEEPIGSTAAHGDALEKLFRDYSDGFINPIAPLVRTSVFLEFPLYEDMFSEGESIYWRIATKYKFFYSDEPLVVMRYHDKNMGKAIKKNMDMHLICLSRLSSAKNFPKDTLPLLNAYRAEIVFSNSWHCLRTNFEIDWAKNLMIESIKFQPSLLFSFKYFIGMLFALMPRIVLVQANKATNLIFQKKFVRPLDDYYN